MNLNPPPPPPQKKKKKNLRECSLRNLRCSGYCNLSWVTEMLCSKHTSKIGCSDKNVSLLGFFKVFWILIERKTQSPLVKLSFLVKIYLFSWDIEVLLCDIFLLPGKIITSFILDELTVRYLQWPGKRRWPVSRGAFLNSWISWEVHLFWWCIARFGTIWTI